MKFKSFATRFSKRLKLYTLVVLGLVSVAFFGSHIDRQYYLSPGAAADAGKSIQVNSGSPLPRSLPVRLLIPKIGVNAPFIQLGLNKDGTLQTPYSPVEVGWYKNSPTPGEVGSSVVVGHLDYIHYGPAVFWKLNKISTGDLIEVERADGRAAMFKVNSVEEYPQNNFPSKTVYGNVNYPSIRLITCGGVWNNSTRHYSEDTVVYAALTN